ncbi:patatin-like phospholipase family protein [Priestia flexa]|uniref:patatin-like phospholipase family protein n=1 Tax=Priestia flexa TaxID=86664 RepID=UPI00203EE952|nr:patatin-like phospholipase family protein [Priestia flexa]MCM3066642.1 patatin-like phospholipase family protein [Priestia flexa]MCP1190575.1 patatin-like phospholipase family protein [Priestia flexa]
MYIDGVFSGGGLKGFALIGALQALEERDFIFRRLAGTSAGSIVCALIVAGYTSDEMMEMMDEMNVKSLLDQRVSFLPSALTKWLLLYWNLGLYKGEKLEKWIASKLKARGIVTFGDLPEGSLRIIASDLTNSKLVILPDDLPRYGIDSKKFPVAKAVRMSCSIPYFFEPVRLRTNPVSLIVDGGVLSNFPIFLFDDDQKRKQRPVLGIKLSPREKEEDKKNIKNAIAMFSALFDTMKDAHDARHISKRHERNIIFLPVSEVFATEFSLPDEQKHQLFHYGKNKAELFLKRWCY